MKADLMPTEEELFAAVDSLLELGPLLPPLAERKRLREAAGLTQEGVATVLRTKRETVNGWETGRTTPRPPRLAAYKRLLDGWAARYPATDQTTLAPVVPQPFASAAPDRMADVPQATAPAPAAATRSMEQGDNPARHIKGDGRDAVAEGE